MSRRTSSRSVSDPAQVFAALGDGTRLMLVAKLSDGQPRPIVRLTSEFRLTRQAVTKHLRVLELAGLVASSRVGRERQFSYVPKPIEEARSYLARVSEEWDNALARLKSFVER